MKNTILLIAFVQAAVAMALPRFQEVAHFNLAGDTGWDALTYDPATKHLYVTHGERVLVVDPASGQTVAEVADTQGVHQVALAESLGVGFTSNGKAGTVGVFDLKNHKVTMQIPVGQNPDAVLYDEFSKQVFAFNGKSHDVSIIDAQSKKVVATLALDGKPEFAVSDAKGTVFVNLEDKSQLVMIDAKARKLLSKHSLKPCEEPTGIALDSKRQQIFVGCSNKLMAVVDATSGKVGKTFPVGDGVDGVAFDAKHDRVFVSAGEGKLGVFHVDGGTVEKIEDAPTQKGARTLAVDEVSGKVFLVSAKFGPPEEKDGRRRPKILPGTFVLLVMAEK